MKRHQNITLPNIKIIKNPTTEELKELNKLRKETEATDEDIQKWNTAILNGEVGYIDENGNPQLYPR